MTLLALLEYVLSRPFLAHAGASWGLLLMALLYPSSAVVLLRRYGSALLPGLALLALMAYALPLAIGLAALPVDPRIVAITAGVALAQTVVPIGLATTTIWHLERRAPRPAPALQLAGGVVGYLAGIPLALLAGALVMLLV